MEAKDHTNRMIFVHGYLDLYRLDPYEFRVLAHIARRGTCISKVETIALICKISVRKVQGVLKTLCQLGLVEKETRKGKTTQYRVAPVDAWEKPEECDKLQKERAKVIERMKLSSKSTRLNLNDEHFDEDSSPF